MTAVYVGLGVLALIALWSVLAYNGLVTARNKAEIFRSRLETTAELGRALARAEQPPPLWLNASTATIYRHADDRPQTEADGELGSGFSVEVATRWEETFFAAARPGVRQVAMRTAITLGNGSALTPLVMLTRFGMGGPQLGGKSGGGRQRFSWIHLDDVFRAMRFLETSPLDGPVNFSSPHPSTNREVMATLRRVLGVPIGIPLPRPALGHPNSPTKMSFPGMAATMRRRIASTCGAASLPGIGKSSQYGRM